MLSDELQNLVETLLSCFDSATYILCGAVLLSSQLLTVAGVPRNFGNRRFTFQLVQPVVVCKLQLVYACCSQPSLTRSAPVHTVSCSTPSS